jgi:hypothetical protein
MSLAGKTPLSGATRFFPVVDPRHHKRHLNRQERKEDSQLPTPAVGAVASMPIQQIEDG